MTGVELFKLEETRDSGLLYLNEAIQLNNAKSLAFLGCLCLENNGAADIDETKGIQYTDRAIEQGNSDAIFCRALYHYRKNQLKVYLKFIEEASDKENIFALLEYGHVLLYGRSYYEASYPHKIKELNPRKGFSLLSKADEKGNLDATFKLAILYKNGYKDIIKSNPKKAKELLLKCESDDNYINYIDQRQDLLEELKDL